MKFPPYGYSVLPPPWAVFVYARKHSERPALLKLSWSWESVTGGVRRSFGKVIVEASCLPFRSFLSNRSSSSDPGGESCKFEVLTAAGNNPTDSRTSRRFARDQTSYPLRFAIS